MKILAQIAFWLVIIGGLNWGLIGFFDWNLVGSLLGTGYISRIIYSIVGVSAVCLILNTLWVRTPVSRK